MDNRNMKNDRFAKFRCSLWIILAVFVACGLSGLLLGQWLLSGCLWWECVDHGYFESQDIQLPREFFPSDAVYGQPGNDRHTNGAKQLQFQQIYWGEHNNSTALLHVYRYFGASGAKRGFATEVRILSELFDVPLERSAQLNYESAAADQLFLACGKKALISGGRQCVFVARYEEDLISLNMTIDTQMPLTEFQRVVQYIDTVSAERLGH